MSYIDQLLSRFSTDSLNEPAPNSEQLHTILSTAMRAPDHGRLRPWRFAVIEGEHRQSWAETVQNVLSTSDDNFPPEYVQKVARLFSIMPMTIVLGMRKQTENTKIPLNEQLMATSAAVMNVLNGLHAMGFSGKWVTGPINNSKLQNILGMEEPYSLLGFLFVGTPAPNVKAPQRVAIDDYVTFWRGTPVKFKADI